MPEDDLNAIVQAKRREIDALGLDFGYRYAWPLGPFPTDGEQRTAPHGDPLLILIPPTDGR